MDGHPLQAAEALGRDLLLALRTLRRRPGIPLWIVASMAVGMGTMILAFNAMDQLLLRPLPYPDAPALHLARSEHPRHGTNIVHRQSVYAAFATGAEGVAEVAAAARLDLVLELTEGARQMDAIEVSPSFLPMFGATLEVGRAPAAAETLRDGPGVVLSNALWRSAFGADPGVLDRDLTLRASQRHGQGESRETLPVVGVLDAAFAPPFNRLDPQLYVVRDLTHYTFEDERWVLTFVRLRQGDRAEEVATGLRHLEAEVLARTSETTDWELGLLPLREFLVGPLREPVALLFLAGCLVFGIAAFNAAGLAAARLQARSGEAAVRMTLGAARGRLLQFLLAEGTLMALAAGALGWILAFVLLRAFEPLAAQEFPLVASLGLSPRVVAFALAAVAATSLVLAVFPALLLVRRPLADRLNTLGVGGTSTGAPARVRFVFVAAQLASAVTLAVAALLLQLSSVEIAAIDPGFEAERAVVAWVDLEADDADPEARTQLFARLLEAFEGNGAIEAAGLTSDLPLSRGSAAMEVGIERPREANPWSTAQLRFAQVSPGYFEAMGIQLVDGRLFRPGELRPASFIVSRSAARRLFGDDEPVGRRLKLGGIDSPNPWLPVVGVVEDVHAESLRKPVEPTLYLPMLSSARMALVARFADAEADLSGLIPDLLHRIDPGLPVARVEPLQGLVDRDTAHLRLTSSLMSFLALVALVLAATGAYGTIWSVTLSRLAEMRIRLALGAAPGDLVLRTARVLSPWILLGIAGGVAGAYLFAGLLRAQLYAVGLADLRLVTTLALVLGLLGAGGLLIPYVHHRRLETASLLKG